MQCKCSTPGREVEDLDDNTLAVLGRSARSRAQVSKQHAALVPGAICTDLGDLGRADGRGVGTAARERRDEDRASSNLIPILTNGVHKRFRRPESIRDLSRGPVLAIVGRIGMGNVEQVGLEVLEVGLGQADAEGENKVGRSAANGYPPCGQRPARFVRDASDGCARRERVRGSAEGELEVDSP
ncbi:hypothetical protein NUW54_g12108 [Trametes sanguinea]|uniref:Uncharacterized protein n=1 Tax=Trametes sanguinea TaxID=158606 RepID=A0ACC1N428_9APHY|nr:hypothetical protein NUW54_g12108 [Trametes sanguinea]